MCKRDYKVRILHMRDHVREVVARLQPRSLPEFGLIGCYSLRWRQLRK
jgi:hypothetical protein